jgi:hypothetical protein
VIDEKRIRDAAVLGALHGIVFEDDVEMTNTPCFDGGVRGERPPRHVEPPRGPSEDLGPAWREYELEDGADLFFGQLGER